MKYKKHYDMTGHVMSYEAENGYTIKGNGGRSIWGGWLPSDFWYVYDPNGERVTGFEHFKECKAYVEALD